MQGQPEPTLKRIARVRWERVWRVSALILAILSLIFLVVRLNSHFGPKFRAEAEEFLDKPVPDDLWFAEDGDLVTVRQRGANLQILKWELSAGRQEVQSSSEFDLRQLHSVHGPVNYVLDSCGERSPSETGVRVVVFSISQDGGRLAWVDEGFLSWGSVAGSRLYQYRSPFRLQHNRPVEHLVFTGDSLVTLIYDDGYLETVDLSAQRIGVAGTTLAGGWSLWSHGALMALSAFPFGDAALVRIENVDRIDHYVHSDIPDGTALAAWASSYLAVGTRGGSVLLLRRNQPTDEASSIPVVPNQMITTVAFYDKTRILVGGNFEDIYQIEYEKGSVKRPSVILEHPAGVKKIVTNGSYLAVLSSALMIAKVGEHPSLTEDGWFIINSLSFLIGIAGSLPTIISWWKKKI